MRSASFRGTYSPTEDAEVRHFCDTVVGLNVRRFVSMVVPLSLSLSLSVCLSVLQTVWVFPAGLLAVSLSVVMLASLSVKLFTLHTTRSVWPTMCFSIRVSVCLSVHLSPHLSVYLPHGLFVCPSIPLSICLYACSPACRFIHIPLCLSMLSASPSFELSVYLLVCRRIND